MKQPSTATPPQPVISDTESLDHHVAKYCALRVSRAALMLSIEKAKAELEKKAAPEVGRLNDAIDAEFSAIHGFCTSQRAALFPDKKSRETNAAEIGFRLNPHHVETTSRKIKWDDVLQRLKRLVWGKAYVRTKESIDKDALLNDREAITPEMQTAVGIRFVQDEDFFITPKSEVLDAQKVEAA